MKKRELPDQPPGVIPPPFVWTSDRTAPEGRFAIGTADSPRAVSIPFVQWGAVPSVIGTITTYPVLRCS